MKNLTCSKPRFLFASVVLALLLIVLAGPAQSRDKKPCIGAGCKSEPSSSSPKAQPPIQVSLKVTDKTGPALLSRNRIQWGEMKVTASVTGLPANSPAPLYRFEMWGWNEDVGVISGNQPLYTSGEFNSTPHWNWTPPPASVSSLPGGWHVKFIVTVQLALPEGMIVRTGEAGPYFLANDEKARHLWSTYIGPVITFHRCANCHNAGDSPTQGDDRHMHVPAVNRQIDCRQCHGETNGEDPGSPPGAPGHWRMPPPALSFAGKSAEQICRQIKDPAQNGGRSLEEVRDHVRTDPIVKWAWTPGPGRTPAPFSWESIAFNSSFGAFINWVRFGAACPEESASPLATAGKVDQVCCAVVPNASLKGRLGRLVIAYPAGTVPTGTRVAVFKDGKEVQADYGSHSFELLSGTYEVSISGKRVSNVTVKAGHDTHVKVGVLRITGAANTRAAVLDRGQEIAGGYGGELIGLPAGSFDVQMAGQTERVTISEGKITDF